MKKRLAWLGASAALALPFWSCAPTPAPRRAAPPPPAAFATPGEARATLLMREDERRYDESVLSAGVASPDPAVRKAAAHAIGEIADPRGLKLLEDLAGDPDASVRAAAALGIEISRDPAETPALLPLLKDSSSAVRCAAARAAGILARADGQDALVAALPTAPPAVRPCILYALAPFNTEPAAEAARGFVRDADPEIRRAAIYAISRTPVESSRETLSSALTVGDPDAAAFAARGLGLIGDPASLSALGQALDSRDPGVLESAMIAIEQIEEKKGTAIPADRIARIVALASSSDPNVALSALFGLRQFLGDRDAARAVNTQAASGTGRRRQVALYSAIAAYRERGKPFLDSAANSTDVALRAAAAESLAYLSEGFAAPYRERFLADAEPVVREAAVNSFPADTLHHVALAALLTDKDAGVRSAVLDRLGSIGDPAVLPELARGLAGAQADSIPDAAISAVTAASRFRDADARALLNSALSFPRAVVRHLARRALIDLFRADPASLPEASFTTGKTIADYRRILEGSARPSAATVVTSRGTFSFDLDGTDAPLTVENFRSLAGRKFFDGTPIHRVVPNFVVQAGDPSGTGHGGPGYEIRDEISSLGYARGTVGMALDGADTGGSQFFVTLSPQPHLDGRYTVFGRVKSGQDVLERIEQGDRIVTATVAGAP
jgi:cyclophilin family peptidyl-prolyl cis-trans isomerase/HEAT repeat protein